MAKKRDAHTGDGPDGDEGALFRRTVADAAPLKRRRPAPPLAATPPAAPAKPDKAALRKPARITAPLVPRPAPAPQPVNNDDGKLAGIDRRTADRLRRGKLAIEGRLDLHGSFQDDAHRMLNGFIVNSAAAGRRVVLVITGKGRISEGGGVLRRNVPQWLRMSPCAPHVLAIVPAQPQHGGAGALYVMLRRKRES